MTKTIKPFLDVVNKFCLYSGEEFSLFMAVINEHCINKGIYDIETIEKVWNQFKQSLEIAVRNMTTEKRK